MKNYFEFTKDAAGIKYCYSRKPIIDEREIHPYHEILYYLDGGATFICEGFTKKLSPNTLILIPRDTYHFFRLDHPEKFERLKISFNNIAGFEELLHRELSCIRIFDILNEKTLSISNAICENLPQIEVSEKNQAFLHGSLLLLLSSIEADDCKAQEKERDRLIGKTLTHIENNISKDLSTEAVARIVGVSSSTLSHTFKREMGISLHKYVTQKRVALAMRLISAGNNPTKIYTECGFNDYSSFYKAFVKLNGQPPSQRDGC